MMHLAYQAWKEDLTDADYMWFFLGVLFLSNMRGEIAGDVTMKGLLTQRIV
jgi:hypothetical protein